MDLSPSDRQLLAEAYQRAKERHEKYVASPTGVYFRDEKQNIVGHVSLGGDLLEMPVNGKFVLFEMHRYFGPQPVIRKTLYCLQRIPAGFWDAYERWDAGGKMMNENVCVVPAWCSLCRGSGNEEDPSAKGMAITCRACNGTKVRSVRSNRQP